MPHQPMPRTDRGPSVDDCLALSAYWEAEAANPEAHGETILVCLAEAKHWRHVARELKLLMQATPCSPVTPGESGRRSLFRAGQANVRRFLYSRGDQRQPRQ
jgi:hypothetical protein